jgi:hypothetical protein
MVFVLTLSPQHMQYNTLVPSPQWLAISASAGLFTLLLVVSVVRRWGNAQILNITLVPVCASLASTARSWT